MAKFIEVTPIKYGEEQPRMIINTDKIDYVREDSDGLAVIHLKDVPLEEYTKKPRFDNPIFVAEPFIFLVDKITKTDEVE